MANKFVDQNGLLYFWQKLLAKFQKKEEGKGLSTNDYTNDDKNKLTGIEEGANKTTIVDNLTSESADSALSAKQGKLLNDSIAKITTDIGELGGGDMMKALYDKDDDGKVDTANDAEKLGGKLPSAYAEAWHIHDNATAEKDGFISKEDKAKLNGIEEGANKYTLPNATDTVLGGIKVGENLSITEDGVLSADAQHIDVDDALNAESVNPVQNKIVKAALDEKVAKEDGKGLSANDYTDAEKTKLEGIEEKANNYVHPESHAATMIIEDETHRFVTDTEKAAWNNKVDKEEGKGLSTNDYTTAEKEKLAGIAENANNYVHPESHAATMITEDATHRFATDDEKTAWNGKIDSSTKGQANGVASLDENGLIPSGQLPSYVDDVVEGYADVATNTTTDESGYTTTTTTINGFYSDAEHKNAVTGEAGKIYIDVNTNISYRWGGTVFVTITSTDCTAVTNAEIDAIVATTV